MSMHNDPVEDAVLAMVDNFFETMPLHSDWRVNASRLERYEAWVRSNAPALLSRTRGMHYRLSEACELCGLTVKRHSRQGACPVVLAGEIRPRVNPHTGEFDYSETDVYTTPTWKTHPLACQPCTKEQAAVIDLVGRGEICGYRFSPAELDAANLLARHGVIQKRSGGCSVPHYGPHTPEYAR